MTSGGMTPQQKWREVDYFPFTVLHKKWPHSIAFRGNALSSSRLACDLNVLPPSYPIS
jgi:hypothetical protein